MVFDDVPDLVPLSRMKPGWACWSGRWTTEIDPFGFAFRFIEMDTLDFGWTLIPFSSRKEISIASRTVSSLLLVLSTALNAASFCVSVSWTAFMVGVTPAGSAPSGTRMTRDRLSSSYEAVNAG